MTFCIAWKTQKESYIISDEIVSKPSSLHDRNKSTIFGESLEVGDGVSRCDGIIKSHFGENYIASLVGDISQGDKYLSYLLACVDDYGLSIPDSIGRTIENFNSGYSGAGFEVVVSCYFNEAPRLYVMRPSGFCELDDGIYFFGSPLDDFKDYVSDFFNSFLLDYSREWCLPKIDEIFFVKILTAVQFYGVHNNTVSNGIGGCYVGGWCDSLGVNRQPPVLYLMSGENPIYQIQRMVGVIPKEDFVVAVPGRDETLRVLIPFNRIDDMDYEKASLIAMSCVGIHDAAGYEYVALLNVIRKSIVVIWTDKNLFNADVIFDLTYSDEGDFGMVFSQRVLFMLNRLYDSDNSGTYHSFLPVQSASMSQIKEFKERRLDLYLTMGLCSVELGYRCVVSSDVYRRIFLSEDMIGVFLSDFSFKIKDFIIVDQFSDLVAIEVKDGRIVFPEEISNLQLLPGLKEVGRKLFYWFEFVDPDDEFNWRTVVVAEECYDKAVESAISKVSRVWPNFDSRLIYIGEVYYHAIAASVKAFSSNEERGNERA